MTAVRLSLLLKMKFILNSTFKVKQISKGTILFKSVRKNHDEFYLYPGVLTEYEVLEIARILSEVYSNSPFNNSMLGRPRSANRRDLNLDSELSGQIVGTVIGLESSALHKLLLLTSATHFLFEEHSEVIVSLARSKKEYCSDPEEMFASDLAYSNLKNLYILPGVAARTHMPSYEPNEDGSIEESSIEDTSKLAAFLSNNSDSLTLGEHLKLDFDEAITTRRTLPSFRKLFLIQKILKTDYRDLAMTMTADELNSLTYLLSKWDRFRSFPVDIVRNRSIAMSQSSMTRFERQVQSVQMYLSDVEGKSVSSLTFIKQLDNLVTDQRRPLESNTPPFIYAALAEVLSVKGERRALDVASELIHLKGLEKRTAKVYEATVALIAESLKPENNDFPFSWIAQMSEHSWVLDSNKPDAKESAELALSSVIESLSYRLRTI